MFCLSNGLKEYLAAVHRALSVVIRHALQGTCSHPAHSAGSGHPWARYVLQQYRRLWDIVADFPELIQYDGCPPFDDPDEEIEDEDGDDGWEDAEDEGSGDDTEYRKGLSNLLVCHTTLSIQEECVCYSC